MSPRRPIGLLLGSVLMLLAVMFVPTPVFIFFGVLVIVTMCWLATTLVIDWMFP